MLHHFGTFLMYATLCLLGLARGGSGLHERPRNWEDVLGGGGLALICCSCIADRAAESPNWQGVAPWGYGFAVIGAAMYAASLLLRDQRMLRDDPLAWGRPPRVAELPCVFWVIATYALAAATMATYRWCGGFDASLWAFFSSAIAATGYGWLRCRLRESAPEWLMALGRREGRGLY